MYKRGVGLRYGGGSRGGRGGRGRRRLLGLADFGVALSKLQPDGLGQVGIETDTLLQFDKFFRYVKATLFFLNLEIYIYFFHLIFQKMYKFWQNLTDSLV